MTLTGAEGRRELGMPLARGAHPLRVVAAIVQEGRTLAGAGLLAGFATALAAAPLVVSQRLGVTPLDLPTLAGVPAILLLVAAAACYLPARRASAIDPMDVLRN